jgi:hypothetical protein
MNARLNTELVPQRSIVVGAAASTTKIQIGGLSMMAVPFSLHGNNAPSFNVHLKQWENHMEIL